MYHPPTPLSACCLAWHNSRLTLLVQLLTIRTILAVAALFCHWGKKCGPEKEKRKTTKSWNCWCCVIPLWFVFSLSQCLHPEGHSQTAQLAAPHSCGPAHAQLITGPLLYDCAVSRTSPLLQREGGRTAPHYLLSLYLLQGSLVPVWTTQSLKSFTNCSTQPQIRVVVVVSKKNIRWSL